MQDTIRVQIRWPRPLVEDLHRIAASRHTTFSELVRRAAIDHFSLARDDGNGAHNGATIDMEARADGR